MDTHSYKQTNRIFTERSGFDSRVGENLAGAGKNKFVSREVRRLSSVVERGTCNAEVSGSIPLVAYLVTSTTEFFQ